MQKLANWSQKGAKGSPNGPKNEENGAKLSTRSAGKRPNVLKNQPSEKVKQKGAKSTDSQLFWFSHLWVLPR